ncbi:MAG: TetR/AcrR family transcriptional regulator [Acidimicrobiales bacterium]
MPTVAEAAERALVSRATAYRYFPSQQSLLVELQADATQPSPDETLERAGGDIAARVEAISREITRMVLADEALFRNQMRMSQELWFARDGDASVPVREGRRLAWIDKALDPAAGVLPKAVMTQLRNALAVVIGVEPVISLRDVRGLSAKATEDCLASTSVALVQAAARDFLQTGTAPPSTRSLAHQPS